MAKRFKWLTQFKHGEKGFTLIELLVVVAILGILAAVAIPAVTKFVETGKVSAANTELATAQTAAMAYMADNPNNSVAFGNTQITPYVSSTKPLQGTYHFLPTGDLDETTANVPTYPGGPVYDTTLHQFK